MKNDPLTEAEMHLFYTQLERQILEPERIAHMAKLFGISPEELYRQRAEGLTLEEQRIRDKALQELNDLHLNHDLSSHG